MELDDHYSGFLIRWNDKEEKIGPVDVEAEILREIRSHVDKYVIEGSRKLSTVVVGVPARFNQLQRECTLAACRKVFEAPINVKLLDEPVAAIIHYFESNVNFEPGYYLVYDFGSGTFDLTLVEYERADSYAIKERDGDDKLGGTDIDLALLEYVILRVQVDFSFDLREKIEKSEKKKAMLLQRCEKVKMNVTACGQDSIDITDFIPRENRHAANIDDDDDEVLIPIDRELFNGLIKGIVDRTTAMIDKLLEKYNEDDIKAIILVGGTSSIPFISETLREKYQKIKISENISKTDCVAKGACIFARKEVKSEPSYSGLSVNNVMTISKCSFGVAVLEGKIYPLIERGEQLPCKKSKLFTTTEDDQHMISIAIFGGEGEGDFQKNCRLIKVITFERTKKAEEGVPRIEITFDVDVNNNITVTCSEVINTSIQTLLYRDMKYFN